MIDNLVSVIIPSFNRGHLIQRTINSALSQSYSPIEIIIVDDGSTDNTQEIISSCYSDKALVRYFYKENGGVSSARNFGINVANGEFIAFLDSDDYWFPDKLALQMQCLKNHPNVGLVYTEFSAMDIQGKVLHSHYLHKMYSVYRFFPRPMDIFSQELPLEGTPYLYYIGQIYSPMVLGNLVHTSSVVLRKSLFEQSGVFDETLLMGEDYELYLRISAITDIAFINHPLLGYCINEEDALTAKKHHLIIAMNYLQTLKRSLHSPKMSLDLPSDIVMLSLADAYRWVAGEYANSNQFSKSLFYFFNSLLIKPNILETYKDIIKLIIRRPI